ncbi:hypothetical protein DCAR_0102699 [Daucus carota subsp. sativus]|uniref:EF-hand domain-containing protein n=1 Tax=Daucus carota subsp. sativus TaxID=79200 RepID=A0AAF0W8C0_DAUCS|nr:PREDICTED: uncharacterized protein LOC108209895 [Daucus carota subsp. sativus]WOG83523.1 hypothetical protein DCAR_0102699 [Daucus carota subsp. sativus]
MNHLQAIAKAYYRQGPESTKENANRFSDAMKKDREGKVDYVEFKEYLRRNGHGNYAKRTLFDELGSKRRLGFWEVMTLFYIIVSRRPFCKKCDRFVTAEYFACVKCFESSADPYCICIDCFRRPGTDYRHGSCDHPKFLDNCTMLARRPPVPQPRIEHAHRHSSHRPQPTAMVESPAHHSRRRSTSQSSQPTGMVESFANYYRRRSTSQSSHPTDTAQSSTHHSHGRRA